jgi:hypothetical protein
MRPELIDASIVLAAILAPRLEVLRMCWWKSSYATRLPANALRESCAFALNITQSGVNNAGETEGVLPGPAAASMGRGSHPCQEKSSEEVAL